MLTVKDLSIQVAGKTLLTDLSLTIEAGQSWFIYGANGVGKSTLMRALAGLDSQQAAGIAVQGTITLNGILLHDLPPVELAQKRAWLPQTQSDAFGWTVFETVLAARFPHHGGLWENREDMSIAEDALKQMDLEAFSDRDIRTLSGGERQRVAIASLIAQQTPLILMDEPATSLDLPHQHALMQFINRQAAQQRALVTIVHDLNLARLAATHVLLLNGDGRWQAGERTAMMTEENLSLCLHCPVRQVPYGNETVFVAV